MKSLFVNTVTPHTTIALFGENTVMVEKRWKAEMNEAEKLQPAVDELLKSQNLQVEDIQQLIICTGPGGFTSSRIGVSAVNAWAFAKGIPVAQVSVFDLYDVKETMLVLSSNANEAWIQVPGKEPTFLNREEFMQDGEQGDEVIEPRFQFGGIIHEEWRKFLEEQGGVFRELEESLPSIDHLEFRHEVAKPWYYKEANITWSEKIRK